MSTIFIKKDDKNFEFFLNYWISTFFIDFSKDKNISPYRLVDSIKIKSITSAYCKFGDSYHWINFIKLKPKGFLGKLKERLFGKDSAVVKNYPYGGYLESVFGDIFSHCKEECYCVINVTLFNRPDLGCTPW